MTISPEKNGKIGVRNLWIVTLEDRTTGQTSEMVSDRILLQSNRLVACALEGWYVDDNTDVPGDTRFYSMSYKAYGVPMMNVHLDPWYSSFAPQEIIDQCFVEIIQNPYQVKLHTAN